MYCRGASTLLPQFIQTEHTLPIQFSALLAITIAVDVVVLSAYAYLTLRGAQSLRATRITVRLERASGAALIPFGIRLLTTNCK